MAFQGGGANQYETATIANGQTVSSEVSTHGLCVVGLELGTMTSTSLTFQAKSVDGETWLPIKTDDGNSYSVTVASNTYVVLDIEAMKSVLGLKIVAGSSEAAERTINVILQPI